jgi:hypothetical protein
MISRKIQRSQINTEQISDTYRIYLFNVISITAEVVLNETFEVESCIK